MIGVLRYDLLCEKLNEDAMAEDADFATRMYARGFKALMVDGVFYEQAPLSWKDFYRQRKRWYYGWPAPMEIQKGNDEKQRSQTFLDSSPHNHLFPYSSHPVSSHSFLSIALLQKRPKIVIGLLIYSIVLQFSAISAF